jgi:hypothetical protein
VSGSLYFAALAGALAICVIGGLMAHRARRRCRCRHCGYELE